MPDRGSAIAVSAGAACTAVKTTPLLTMYEGMEAMATAARCGCDPVDNSAKTAQASRSCAAQARRRTSSR